MIDWTDTSVSTTLVQVIVDSVDPTETGPSLASFDKVYDIVSCSNS